MWIIRIFWVGWFLFVLASIILACWIGMTNQYYHLMNSVMLFWAIWYGILIISIVTYIFFLISNGEINKSEFDTINRDSLN